MIIDNFTNKLADDLRVAIKKIVGSQLLLPVFPCMHLRS